MQCLQVAERFISVNGEGQRQGTLAAFVRLAGCNLRCSYCDTAWAWKPSADCQRQTPSEIYQWLKDSGVRNVTLTGGEPLLHCGVDELLRLMAADKSLSVEVETNGSVDLSPFMSIPNRPAFTVDYKLPASGMEAYMHLPSFALLDKRDTVKFVCADKADLERALQVMRQLKLSDRVAVYLSPVFGSIKPADIVDFMQRHCLNGVHLQLQIHKYIWPPESRGV